MVSGSGPQAMDAKPHPTITSADQYRFHEVSTSIESESGAEDLVPAEAAFEETIVVEDLVMAEDQELDMREMVRTMRSYGQRRFHRIPNYFLQP